jgi:hypothetical protein
MVEFENKESSRTDSSKAEKSRSLVERGLLFHSTKKENIDSIISNGLKYRDNKPSSNNLTAKRLEDMVIDIRRELESSGLELPSHVGSVFFKAVPVFQTEGSNIIVAVRPEMIPCDGYVGGSLSTAFELINDGFISEARKKVERYWRHVREFNDGVFVDDVEEVFYPCDIPPSAIVEIIDKDFNKIWENNNG